MNNDGNARETERRRGDNRLEMEELACERVKIAGTGISFVKFAAPKNAGHRRVRKGENDRQFFKM